MEAHEFKQWWSDQALGDAYFSELNRHYEVIEARPEGFDHLASHAFGDIISLRQFPTVGFCTLITKGLSGFKLMTHADDHSIIRAEVAWTLRADRVVEGAVELFARVADSLLERRHAFHQNELFAFDFSSLQCNFHLTHFLASNGYWLGDGFERLGSEFPMYVFELFALTEEEARMAAQDIDAFAAYVEAHSIDLESLER